MAASVVKRALSHTAPPAEPLRAAFSANTEALMSGALTLQEFQTRAAPASRELSNADFNTAMNAMLAH